MKYSRNIAAMFHNFTAVIRQFTSYKNFEFVISNDDNNSSKESKCFQRCDTFSKSTQNSEGGVLPDKGYH